MTKLIRDLCPVHGVPMWWWPTGGEWACQVTTCDVTRPVNRVQWEAERATHAMDALRYAMLHTPPSVLSMNDVGIFRNVGTA